MRRLAITSLAGHLRACASSASGAPAPGGVLDDDVPLSTRFPSFVSFAAAPGLFQAPLSDVGRNIKDCDPAAVQAYVVPDLITPEQEQLLLRYSGAILGRLPFERAHEDALIHHYKELYRSQEALLTDDSLINDAICGSGQGDAAPMSLAELAAMRDAVRVCAARAQGCLPHTPLQDRVHFIRIGGNGFIRAHADESRNSSGIVAGLTLGSGRVMSLTHPKQFPGARVDLLLAPRSFYMLTGTARYDWEHSVDWVADDASHDARMRMTSPSDGAVLVGGEGSQVLFDGRATGLHRSTRTALIWRGVSPMELLMRRSGMAHRRA